MGYISHNAIVVTCWDKQRLEGAQEKAASLLPDLVSPIVDSPVNGYASFFVAPDGSKEGWEESDAGDRGREEFTDWLLEQRHSDNSTWFEWAEISYGNDDRKVGVMRHPWDVEIIEVHPK